MTQVGTACVDKHLTIGKSVRVTGCAVTSRAAKQHILDHRALASNRPTRKAWVPLGTWALQCDRVSTAPCLLGVCIAQAVLHHEQRNFWGGLFGQKRLWLADPPGVVSVTWSVGRLTEEKGGDGGEKEKWESAGYNTEAR
jgi:hypothetical protein